MNPNDHPPLYKLQVYTFAGEFKHGLVLDSLTALAPGARPLNLTDGPAFEVRPGGDCRQASFSGVFTHLNISYEDIVEVLYSSDNGITWKPRWAGYADTVPNVRSADPDTYNLLGLRQRLDRVEARSTIAEDFPNRQWAQLINDCLDTGQLGRAISRAPVPALGIGEIRGAIVPRYESLMQIADKWLVADTEDATAGIGDYGVNAKREPIWGKPDGLHVFDEASGIVIEAKAGSSAKLRTHIRATWVNAAPGPYVVFGENLLKEQEGVQATLLVQVADATLYGHSSRRELMKPLPKFFSRAPCQSVQAWWLRGTAYPLFVGGGLPRVTGTRTECTITGDVSALNDTNPQTYLTVQPPSTTKEMTGGTLANPVYSDVPTTGGAILVTITYPPGPVPWGVALHVLGGTVEGFVFDGVLDVRCGPDKDGLLIFPDEVRNWISDHWDATTTSTLMVRITRTGQGDVQVTTLGALFVQEEVVKQAVQRLAHLPTPDPETIRVPGWDIEPLAWVTCIYRNPDGSEAGRTEGRRADLYRYVVDPDGQLFTEVQVGQADDADEIAFATLVERQTQKAAVAAVLNA